MILLRTPAFLEPGRVEQRDQVALVYVERHLGVPRCGLGVARQRCAGGLERGRSDLHVHDRVGRQLEPQLGAALEQLGTERPPEP